MDATNQLSESKDENIIDPITIAVNSRASLSTPQGALITRSRRLPTNKGINKQRGSAETTNVSAWDRLKENPRQHFLSDEKSSIERHTESKKPEAGLANITRNKAESQSIKECLKKRARQENAIGSTFPSEIQLFRY